MTLGSLPVHEPHYDILAAAVSGTAATLTPLAMLGGGGATTVWLKMLFDSQLLVIELALVAGITGLIRRNESQTKLSSHVAAALASGRPYECNKCGSVYEPSNELWSR